MAEAIDAAVAQLSTDREVVDVVITATQVDYFNADATRGTMEWTRQLDFGLTTGVLVTVVWREQRP